VKGEKDERGGEAPSKLPPGIIFGGKESLREAKPLFIKYFPLMIRRYSYHGEVNYRIGEQ
jgi:hypothetical protein